VRVTEQREDGDGAQTVPPAQAPGGGDETTVATPPPRAGLEMSLFGLVNLDDRAGFEERTARYITDFYDDIAAADGDIGLGEVRAAVTNVTFAMISVTGESSPSGSTIGTDCTLIDPLRVTFTLEVQYLVTSDLSIGVDDIVTAPFATEALRELYVDYLKADDVLDEWEDLRCASEVRLPPDGPAPPPPKTPSPVASEPPTSQPAAAGGGDLPVVVTPPPMDGLKILLYGLESLEEQEEFEVLMGEYISDFYNGDTAAAADPTWGDDDLRSIVTNVTLATVVISDTSFPPGGLATLPDCDLIDPLAVTFSFEVGSYYVTDDDPASGATFDDVVAFPFSTEEFRRSFIDGYVAANDVFGSWDDLLCASGIQFPEVGGGGGGPTTLAPSTAPTLSPDDGSPTTPTVESPPALAGLEMDLFGLISLSELDRVRYAERTAAYIDSFYNGGGGDNNGTSSPDGNNSSLADIRISISDANTSIVVTDQDVALGSVSGDDCTLIDPMTVVFTMEITYTRMSDAPSSTIIALDDVVTYPFSTEEFRRSYIDDYLKGGAGDGSSAGGFQELRCAGEIRLPDGDAQTIADDPPGTDDIFNDLRIGGQDHPLGDDDDGGYNERRCEGRLRGILPERREEFDVGFAYGVELSAPSWSEEEYEDLMGELQRLILDFVAASVLMCPNDDDYATVPRSAAGPVRPYHEGAGGHARAPSVARIRYPEYGRITTMRAVECADGPTTTTASSCAEMDVVLLVTASADVPRWEAHADVLASLAAALRNSELFAEFVPGLIGTSYLGPDPRAASTLPNVGVVEEHDDGPTASSTTPGTTFAVVVSVVCVALMLKATAVIAYSSTGDGAIERVVSYYRRRRWYRRGALPTCSGPMAEEEEGDHYGGDDDEDRPDPDEDGAEALVPYFGGTMPQFSPGGHSEDGFDGGIDHPGSEDGQGGQDWALVSHMGHHSQAGEDGRDNGAVLPFSFGDHSVDGSSRYTGHSESEDSQWGLDLEPVSVIDHSPVVEALALGGVRTVARPRRSHRLPFSYSGGSFEDGSRFGEEVDTPIETEEGCHPVGEVVAQHLLPIVSPMETEGECHPVS